MKITDAKGARSYESLLRVVITLPQNEPVRNYADSIKRALRAFYHRPDDKRKTITANYDNGVELITLTAKTKADADAEFKALYYRVCTPSQYDCTGQWFTVTYKIFKRGDRWMAYHRYALDI